MRNRIMRARPFAAGLVAATMATTLAAAAAAQAGPSYAGYTEGVFLPFVNAQPGNVPFTSPVQLSFSIGGRLHKVIMDTGSTGVMIASSLIPGYTPSAADSAGWEFLSSSKLLFKGHWVPQDLVFHDAAGAPLATARVPVLAVDSVITCRQFVIATGTCPDPTDAKADNATVYMGVGFGREHNGQTQGTPGKNPFLNLTRIGSTPVRPGSFRAGYVITKTGVHVGLTPANTGNFVFEKLQPGSFGPLDWQQAPLCLQVNDSPCVTGAALVDTGIDQMYLTVDSLIPVRTVRRPNPSIRGDSVGTLADGSRVVVRFPGEPMVAFYTFVVGDTANPMAPVVAIPSIVDTASVTFVNTGRHFLRNFDVLFDAVEGWFGLRWTGPVPSPYGGVTQTLRSPAGAGRR
ncbi:MAG TPA: hypothetical protein VFJ16_12455 [Longimicrobium sp.]|nr:hypothetical protein [Longimicrobium sp.]